MYVVGVPNRLVPRERNVMPLMSARISTHGWPPKSLNETSRPVSAGITAPFVNGVLRGESQRRPGRRKREKRPGESETEWLAEVFRTLQKVFSTNSD